MISSEFLIEGGIIVALPKGKNSVTTAIEKAKAVKATSKDKPTESIGRKGNLKMKKKGKHK
jgi:hypothetical protein